MSRGGDGPDAVPTDPTPPSSDPARTPIRPPGEPEQSRRARRPRQGARRAGTPSTRQLRKLERRQARSAGTTRRARRQQSRPRPATVQAAEFEAPQISPGVVEPPIRPDPTAAAFFDVDNTVVQGASLFHLARGLYRRDFFSTRLIFKGIWLQVYFRVVGRENPDHIRQAREAALSFIAGHSVAEVQAIGEEVYEDAIAPRIWPGTRAIAQLHLDVGQPVWLVTAAPVEMASIIADRLGLTGALGTTAEHDDGVYTGRLRGELLHGPAKADAVRALAQEHGFDLAHCFAYSDSFNDLPMLSLVGHPCAINPDGRLAEHAEEQGWQIRDYRTHRRAVRLGLLGTGVAGAAAGAVATGVALRRVIKN